MKGLKGIEQNFPSLPLNTFNLIKQFIIGNSSAGIREDQFMVYIINIGTQQNQSTVDIINQIIQPIGIANSFSDNRYHQVQKNHPKRFRKRK
jgi:hypothetical protein